MTTKLKLTMKIKNFTKDKVDDIGFIHVFVNRVLIKSDKFLTNLKSCNKTSKQCKSTSFPMCGFIAQLVEHRTGIAEVTGSNPVEALIFSGFFFPIA